MPPRPITDPRTARLVAAYEALRPDTVPDLLALYDDEALFKDPFTATVDMEVDELRSQMLQRHARYVPVVDGDNVLGVISFHDVAKAVLDERNFENQMLKGYIKNWPA